MKNRLAAQQRVTKTSQSHHSREQQSKGAVRAKLRENKAKRKEKKSSK
jgi:hypothetical protein